MTLTERQLNRTTLARQLLLERKRLGVVDAVRRVTALALWNRVEGFDPARLDRAFTDQDIVKATLMRITLHAVAADDYPPFQRGMIRTLRASRLHDRRFKSTGLSIADADDLVLPLLDFIVEPRSRREIEEILESQLGDVPDRYIFWPLRTFAPLLHAPTGGPWSFATNAPSYQAAPFDPDWDHQVTAVPRGLRSGVGSRLRPVCLAAADRDPTRTRRYVRSVGHPRRPQRNAATRRAGWGDTR